MTFLIDFLRESLAVLIDTGPYLLLGFFLAGLIRALVPVSWLSTHLGRRGIGSVLKAALIGAPLPLCSCSTLPTAAALRGAGASKGATAAFLVSTPEVGVDSISITYALMDPVMTVARPVTALATAVVAGLGVDALERSDGAKGAPEKSAGAAARTEEAAVPAAPSDCASGCACGEDPPPRAATPAQRPRGWVGIVRESARYGYGELLDDIGPYLSVGILLTGLIAALLPAGALTDPRLQGWPSMLAMLAIGIPLYVCATSSTPIAAALVLKGLNPGAALVFLLAGPATNAASLTVLWRMLGRRALIAYLVAIAVVSLAAGAILNEVYAALGIDAQAIAGAGGRAIPRWIELPAAVLLLALLVRSFARTGRHRVWRERLRGASRALGFDPAGRAARWALAVVALVLYLLSGCSTIGPGEVGWVVEFGRITRSITTPGLVVHAPYPFAELVKESPDRVRSVDRGYRPNESFLRPARPTRATPEDRHMTAEAEVATGEETLLALRYSVQYRAADPYTHRFLLEDPALLVTACADFAVRRVIAEQHTDSVLVVHRARLEREVAGHLQAQLDSLAAGVAILRVDFVDVHAPAEVHPAFRDVASAMEDLERFVRQAESYRNRTVAEARADSFRALAEAEGARLESVERARGEGGAFRALADATRRQRPITQLRLYLDAVSAVLAPARLILPLTDLPLDLWLSQSGSRAWPEPIGQGASPAPAAPQAAPAAAPATGASASETWRQKLERLQGRTR